MARRPIITEDTDDIKLEGQESTTTTSAVESSDEIKLEEVVIEQPPVKAAPAPKRPPVTKPTATKTAPAPAPEPAKVVEPEATADDDSSESSDEYTDPNSATEAAEVIETVSDEEEGANSGTEDTSLLASSECSFTVDTAKFIEFLNCVSFDGVMEDAFINVEAGLKCNAAEPISAQVTSITNFKEAKVITPGTLIISKIDKLVRILKLFKGEVTVAYKDGYIILQSKDSKVKILGEAECYVNSCSQLKGIEIDVENKKIGAFDFSKFSYFEMAKSSFDRIWTTISTVNLDSANFKVSPMSTNLKIEATDGRDTVDISLPIENASINKALNAKFSKCLKSLVNTLKGDKVSVWLSDICMIVKQADNYYVLMVTPA